MTASSSQGIVAAPVLPMLPDYSIDWTSLRSYIALDRRAEADGDRDEHGRERRPVARRATSSSRSCACASDVDRRRVPAGLGPDRRLDAPTRCAGATS